MNAMRHKKSTNKKYMAHDESSHSIDSNLSVVKYISW